jgi:hypothetical protein
MQSFLTPQSDLHFFFNAQRQFVSSAESMREHVPGFEYFKKNSLFLKQHMQVRELYMYLEYLKGECQYTTGKICAFCAEFPSAEVLGPVPRPMLDDEALPELCYFTI